MPPGFESPSLRKKPAPKAGFAVVGLRILRNMLRGNSSKAPLSWGCCSDAELAQGNVGFFAATPPNGSVAQDCKRTMVQNVPVLRGFAGDHTDLVSPFVMLDEFGPLQIDPGTLGMDIKAHPMPA